MDDTEIVVPISQFVSEAVEEVAGHCVYKLHVYSSPAFQGVWLSGTALVLAIAIAAIFAIMALTFFVYDRIVRKRNDKVVHEAAQSDAILSSLFPSAIRDRLFAEANDSKPAAKGKTAAKGKKADKSRLSDYLTSREFDMNESHDGDDDDDDDRLFGFKSKPIADLFPETTLMFGDIAGFTAWSSVREPSQVFRLLETIYHAFDEIAKKRRVFKVETVGDCYVAAVGLPDPRSDHAVAMAKFAHECMNKMRILTKKLEVVLGPDTGDLALRVGLHSGPVTGGVLRGPNSRFQLFGDTSKLRDNSMFPTHVLNSGTHNIDSRFQ
jgi:class 3 adenylate cyclase